MRRDRVLVASVGVEEPRIDRVARYLRDAGKEVVAGSYATHEVEGVVQAAVQEDVVAVDVTVSPRNELAVGAALEEGFDEYGGDPLTDMHYRVDDAGREAWMALEKVGETNGQLLADAGLEPDGASFREVYEALREGYAARLGDEERGVKAARAQASTVRTANPRYRDEPMPGGQMSLRWYAREGLDGAESHGL